MVTRFMQVMFSASENNDEELTQQVADDIQATQAENPGEALEDDEVTYVNLGSGKTLIIDKGNGEATVAEQSEDDPDQFDLEGFENDEDLEKYLHTLDGYTPDESIEDHYVEDFEDHMDGSSVISPNLEDGGLNPQAGYEPTVLEHAGCPECGCDPCECEDDDDDEERTYSVPMTEEELVLFSDFMDDLYYGYHGDNCATMKIFSDLDLHCRIFSEVLDEDKPAIIGDLKIEKEDDDTIIVTDLETGDEAQVTVDDDDEFVVSDVQKELSDEEERDYSDPLSDEEIALFSEFCRLYSEDEDEDEEESEEEEGEEDYDDEGEDDEEDDDIDGPEQYEPNFVVGIDPVNHVIVDSPVYTEEDAAVLSQRLEEDGVEGVQVFEDPDDARDYAMDLLGEVGVSEIEQIAEPEEHTFSDVTIYTTRYYSDCTNYMLRLFSEAEDDVTDSQDEIEDAIESGEQVENDSEVITPIDDETAVVYDKEADEYTKVTLDEDELDTEKITEEEADELTQDIDLDDEDDDEDEDFDEDEDDDEEDDDDEEKEKEFSTLEMFFSEIEEQQMQAAAQGPAPVQSVDPNQINPETGDPVNIEPTAVPAQSVETIEDKALAAVQSIQEAANDAVLQIQEAKAAPAPGEEQDLREAQFSDTLYYDEGDTLAEWLTQSV